MNKKILMTQEDFDATKKRLDYLKNDKSKEVAQLFKDAISYGDLSENSEYKAAVEEKEKLEKEIFDLENDIKNAEIIKEENLTSDKVSVGSTVKVKNTKSGDIKIYRIVGPNGVDLEKSKISYESPIGHELLNKKEGDLISLKVPSGEIELEILEIIVRKQDV